MTDSEIKLKIKTLLDEALESFNEDGCDIEVVKIDRENGKVVVEFSLVIIEEDGYAGFSGY
jgi:Fe-S cluster biogenesis protein NfuA